MSHATPTIDEVSSSPSTSSWLKGALTAALPRDPVKAANEAVILAKVLGARADSLLVDHLARGPGIGPHNAQWTCELSGGGIEELHQDTRDLVESFAAALAMKLLRTQRKRGLTNDWAATDWLDEARAELRRHVEKGDPLDVAAYSAFLFHHKANCA